MYMHNFSVPITSQLEYKLHESSLVQDFAKVLQKWPNSNYYYYYYYCSMGHMVCIAFSYSSPMGRPGDSVVKSLPANAGAAGCMASIPGSGRSQEEEKATYSSILAGMVPWTEEAGGLQSMELHRVRHDWSNWACTHSALISSVQLLSHVRLFETPWTAARQASLFITNSQSPPKPTSIESVLPSSHLILCCPLLLLPPIPPSIRVFSNESTLHMRWPKYWGFSFNISPSNEHPGLISFRMDWLDLLTVQGTLKSLLQHHSSKA